MTRHSSSSQLRQKKNGEGRFRRRQGGLTLILRERLLQVVRAYRNGFDNFRRTAACPTHTYTLLLLGADLNGSVDLRVPIDVLPVRTRLRSCFIMCLRYVLHHFRLCIVAGLSHVSNKFRCWLNSIQRFVHGHPFWSCCVFCVIFLRESLLCGLPSSKCRIESKTISVCLSPATTRPLHHSASSFCPISTFTITGSLS